MALGVILRPAELSDCRKVWLWRNEEETRSASFNTALIPYEEHARWFSRKLRDPATRCLIVVDASGRDVGYVRFEIHNDQAELSIAMARPDRGRGYGRAAIVTGVRELLASEPVQRVIALVRAENSPSVAVFERAGFLLRRTMEIGGVTAHEMVCERAVGPGT